MSNQNPPKRPTRADFQQAMQSMDTYIDVTADDLVELNRRAEKIAMMRATESVTIKRIMSQPVHTVHPQTSMNEAAHLMITKHISGLPVVDETGVLIGIITEADFLGALGVPAQHHTHSLWQTMESMLNHLTHHGEMEVPDGPVADHMTRNVVCAHQEQELHDVIELMKRHCVKRVVICDQQRHLRGIVTRSDLVRVFFDHYTQSLNKST